MKKKQLLILSLIALAVMLALLFFHDHTVAVFQPRGYIASRERNLIIFTLLLSLIVVLPVYALTFLIARKIH